MMRDPWHRNHLIRDAIGRAIYDAMRTDPSIRLFGEGAHMKVHFDAPQIEKEFPERVGTLPVSEDGNLNFAVGASLLGVKPVVDVITADFLYRAMDSICNTAAKGNYVSGDEPPKTIVIRSEFLIGGPTTGQRPEALFTHIPGLNVVVPSTPADAYGLMRTALGSPGVTLFFEDRMIKDAESIHELDYSEAHTVPFGSAAFRGWRRGNPPQLTVIAYGLMAHSAWAVLDHAGVLGHAQLDGVDLLDLRTIYPIDWSAVLASARATGKVLIVEPDVAYGGIGAEIAATLAERVAGVVVRRLGAPRLTIPASRDLHDQMMPTAEGILAAVREMLA